MAVLMFKPRFASLVRDGKKMQTIRPVRTRPIKVGDALSLRQWLDLPYRSKQVLLLNEVCRATYAIEIDAYGLYWLAGGKDLMPVDRMDEFARADGFADHKEMTGWFRETHTLPFKGIVISWAQ